MLICVYVTIIELIHFYSHHGGSQHFLLFINLEDYASYFHALLAFALLDSVSFTALPPFHIGIYCH